MKYKVQSETTLFTDLFSIKEAQIEQRGEGFRRIKIQKENASAVLVLNTDSKKIILTKQFRYPILSAHPDPLLEILAGKIDAGETPLQTALRETEEEIGYKVIPENMQLLVSCYPTPGYSSELFYIYYATVTNNEKINKGGGIDSENEFIEVVEMDLVEFFELITLGKIKDAKTYLAAFFLKQLLNI